MYGALGKGREVFAATPPNPGAPEFATLCSAAVAFAWVVAGACLRRSARSIESHAVIGGLVGFGFGSAVYLFGLLTGLY